MTLPELRLRAKQADEQVTRVISALGKWIVVKSLKRQGHEMLQTDVLADGDAQILGREIAQRNSVQSVTLGNEMGIECRLAPILTV